MLERLINEVLSWILAVILAVGLFAALIGMNYAYIMLSNVMLGF